MTLFGIIIAWLILSFIVGSIIGTIIRKSA